MAELQGRYLVAMKRLAEVEVDPVTSNQHELNGVAAIKQLLGTPAGVLRLPDIEWVLLRDDVDHVREHHSLSWYDSRQNNPNRPAEWRLYFDGTTAARAGDLFALIRRDADGSIGAVVAPAGSTWEQQLVTIFGNSLDPGGRFTTVVRRCPGPLRCSDDRAVRAARLGRGSRADHRSAVRGRGDPALRTLLSALDYILAFHPRSRRGGPHRAR